jgi:hypothetical protein
MKHSNFLRGYAVNTYWSNYCIFVGEVFKSLYVTLQDPI